MPMRSFVASFAANQTPTTMPIAVKTPCQVISNPPSLVMLGSRPMLMLRSAVMPCGVPRLYALRRPCGRGPKEGRESRGGFARSTKARASGSCCGLPDLSFDCQAASAEAPEGCLTVRRYLTPEPAPGRVERERQAQEQRPGGQPDEGCAHIPPYRETREGPFPRELIGQAVLRYALSRRQCQCPRPHRAYRQHRGPVLAVRHLGDDIGLGTGQVANHSRRDAGHAGKAKRQPVEVPLLAFGHIHYGR